MENIKSTPNDIIFVFSAQEEVGIRGVKTATYEIEPDIGIVVDVTESSADLPEGELSGSCVLGKGAGIKVMDRKIIVPKMLIDYFIFLADKNKIPYQRDIMQSSGTGAQGIQLSRGGVLAGGISVPVRYMHSACEMCALHDIQACKDLIKAFCASNVRI
jgi:endoglucanase